MPFDQLCESSTCKNDDTCLSAAVEFSVMHASVVLQTELQCLPTQLLMIDCTSNYVVNSTLPSNVEKYVDILQVREFVHNFEQNEPKASYKAARPLLLQKFSALYDAAYVSK